MKIKKADFVCSYAELEQMRPDTLPEFAFVGSSNVGKSSLINMLTNNKGLAKTSGEPGKTRLINQFNINDTWSLIDLPGYGYAKVPKTDRKIMDLMVRKYIGSREQLVCVFLLVDSRHEPKKSDIDFALFLGEKEVPLAFIFTKVDKLSKNKVQKNVKLFKKELSEYWKELPPQFMSSAKNSEGRMEILRYIDGVIKWHATHIPMD